MAATGTIVACLVVARAAAAEPQPDPRAEQVDFDVHDGVLDTLAVEASRKGLELIGFVDPTLPARVVRYLARLRQVLLNLANNAVKFKKRGEVVIRFERATPDDAARELDGAATARRIRRDPTTRDVPIILLTSIGSALPEAIRDLPLLTTLLKPAKQAELRQAIGSAALARARAGGATRLRPGRSPTT